MNSQNYLRVFNVTLLLHTHTCTFEDRSEIVLVHCVPVASTVAKAPEEERERRREERRREVRREDRQRAYIVSSIEDLYKFSL